jgi:hypothetical protein
VIDALDRAGRLTTAGWDDWEDRIIAARRHVRGSIGTE